MTEQANPLMDCLQVRCHKVCVAPRHPQQAVTEYLLEMEHGPAPRNLMLAGKESSLLAQPFCIHCQLLSAHLSSCRVLHPYPDARFYATHPYVGAVCVDALVRICAGGDQ